jgi:anti-sigma B factor antagonist/stage II sporulation protein AA (anti-sigma F factor antagonist)
MLKVYTRNLGNVAVLCLQGRIVNGETAVLREAVAAQANVIAVVLDLARVTAVDASGLGALLDLRKHTESRNVRFKLMNTPKLVARVLEITRLDSVFEIIPRVEPAIVRTASSRVEFAACA